ncbi:hypothetical protein [Chryseosolibacter indicus]|uniref:Uncharacterized protein n=1 Tax=Chryseosolibacter indicus TaxID=2782351 RepID=A0ABS5VRU3_9BACT|nr:hypothetical protein [Chryseosolibacter indicus]MBT1704155.1 hypothetical protein [Chryseosolibacter indicus]
MGLKSEDPVKFIKEMLESKSTAKQQAFKHLCWAFSILSTEAKNVIEELRRRAKPGDADVTVEFNVIHEHEFDVKLAGDMLIFVMNSNIVTFEDSHPVIEDEYVKSNEVNRYFGQIMIYNFMADSMKFNRGTDPGYLLARIMINHEKHFFIEGEKDLTEFNDISKEPLTEDILRYLVKVVLKMAIENDLVTPAFTHVKSTTVSQKKDHSLELGGAQKIGFRMSYENKTEG